MQIGIAGWVLLPLGLLLACLESRRPLLWLLIFFTPFTATAVVNLTSVGIQPAFYLGGLYIVRVLIDECGRANGLRWWTAEWRVLVPFLAFAAVALLSVSMIPLYSHALTVHTPSGDEAFLHLGGQNATQWLYLVFGVTLMITVGLERFSEADLARGLKVFLVSGVFVSLWGWMQVVSHRVGFAYPAQIFNNSVGFTEHFDQSLAISIGGVQRMNSVAPEPSMAAGFLLMPTFLSVYALLDGSGFLLSRRTALVLTMFFGMTLLATTSSTAVFGFAGTFALVLGLEYWSRKPGRAALGGFGTRATALALFVFVVVPLAAAGVATLLLHFSLAEIKGIIQAVALDKLSSGSAQTRMAGAVGGLQLLAGHPLLGVGWGSDRTFDVTTNTLAGAGLIGTWLFIWAHLRVLAMVRRLRWLLVERGRLRWAKLLLAASAGLLAVMVPKVLAEPGLVFQAHWCLLGLMVGSLYAAHDRSDGRIAVATTAASIA